MYHPSLIPWVYEASVPHTLQQNSFEVNMFIELGASMHIFDIYNNFNTAPEIEAVTVRWILIVDPTPVSAAQIWIVHPDFALVPGH